MIVETICTWLFNILNMVINVIPKPALLSISTSGISDIIGFGIWVITPQVFMAIAANILFWSITHLTFAIVMWIYKNIPFN